MKKSIFILVLVWLTMVVPAQTPEKISYQAVIRNSSNALIVNTNIGMRISVLQGSASGSAVFVERHSPTSNANGLVTLEIGAGTLLSGSFSGINWAAGPYFIKTETDPTGGSSYTITGTSQLLGVPYALYAKNVQNKDDADADPTNEIQLLSISGANLSLSKGGGTVTLPSGGGGDNWGTQVAVTDATLSGNGTASSPLKVAPQSATSGQVLKWNGTTWAPAPDETGGGSAGWGLTGNAGTNPASNFIGTTDDKDFIIKRNGVLAGRLSTLNTSFGLSALQSNTGHDNTAIGARALPANTTGSNNTANGSFALYYNTTGDNNTANGEEALYSNTTGCNNTANGYAALTSNSTGHENIAFGDKALFFNTTGYNNTANGTNALYSNTTGDNNTASGFNAIYSNTTGYFNTGFGSTALYSNTTGEGNVAVGREALYSNTTGAQNSAIGYSALQNNTTGGRNTASGISALFKNTTGSSNTATGSFALSDNTSGFDNTADGYDALSTNSTGDSNVANGKEALYHNTTGYSNTADGTVALYSNTTGFYNTASGRSALYYNTTGSYNTAFGVSALQNLTAGNNNTAVGYDAQVPNATGSNQVRIGNAAVTYASCQAPIISTSDRRLKSNIRKSNLGLDFIKQLNPVFYNRKIVEISNGKTNVSESKVFPKTEYGFIAQELEATLNACGASDNGIINKDDAGMYSVRYNDLLAPMVKAIQEQQVLIEKLTKRIEELEKKKH